jgi:hypothetical protein
MTEGDLSLGEGGPLRRIEAASHLTKVWVQIAVAILLTWLPVIAIGIVIEQTTGHPQPLLRDVAMHVRLLVGIPILLFLDGAFTETCRYALGQLLRYDLVTPEEMPRFEGTMRRVRRLDELWLPELVILMLAVALGFAVLRPFQRHPAELWYAAVALPLFEFLLLRSLWRWLLWVKVLVGLARLKLDLEPTHPDRCGGISYLRAPSLNYCGMLLFTTTAVLCAEWGSGFTYRTPKGYIPVLLAFAAFALAVAFGPLVMFIPQLLRARREGRATIGTVVARTGRWCRTRWVDQDPADVLRAPEAQSLAAVTSTYRDTVAQMRFLLVEKRDLITLLLVSLSPVVFLMFTTIPHGEWQSILDLLKPAIP